MKSVYEFSDYRVFLNDMVYGETRRRGLQSELAKAAGCQASYLLQVLKGKAELTEDHSIKLAGYLEFDELETEYFILLLRIARAATKELQQFLEGLRQKLLQQSQQMASRVEATVPTDDEKFLAKYFSTWLPSTIHIATSVNSLQDPKSIAKRFSLPQKKVESVLNFLKQSELVEMNGTKYVFSGNSLHLPRRSDLNAAHQIHRRLQAIKSIQQSDKENIHFASVFAIDQQTFEELKEVLTKVIEQTHKKIHASKEEDVYSFCLDFFKTV